MSPARKVSSAFLALVFLIGVLGADWPRFRGPDGGGISNDKDLPVKWSDKENVVWKTKLPGPGASSPITAGKFIFLTCYTGYGTEDEDDGAQDQAKLRRHLLCLDRQNGRILWDKDVKAKLPEPRFSGMGMPMHGYASNTPATDGKHVYVFFGKSGVLAFDLKGNKVWQKSVGDRMDMFGGGSSVMLYKDLVIVNASLEQGAMVALRKKDGSEAWKFKDIGRTWSTPVLVDVGGKQELVLNTVRNIYGIDPASGKELWHCAGVPGMYTISSVVAKDGIVYTTASGRGGGTTMAIKAGGRGDVTKTHRLWAKNVGENISSPVVYKDHLYWAGQSGMVVCLKTKDGSLVYRERLKDTPPVYSSATVADGKMYVVSRTKGTFALAAEPKFKVLAQNRFKGDRSVFIASPVVSNGQLILRSDKFIYCIGKK
jgi:outer membrane protein assembly factor BamB